jgi:hypothetical protein
VSIQPFRGDQFVIIERRHADGTLDFTEPHPPTMRCECSKNCQHDASPGVMTFDRVYQLFFQAVPEGVGSWEQLKAWLDTKGWVLRAKTW